MRKIVILAALAFAFVSCSGPKVAYHFNYHDYNAGKKTSGTTEVFSSATIDETTLVASANTEAFYPTDHTMPVEHVIPATTATKEAVASKLQSMTKEDRKEFKKDLKTYLKESKKTEVVAGASKAKALSGDLKLAAIFGIVGIVLLIIGGDVLGVLGAIALLVGLFFFIRYLINH